MAATAAAPPRLAINSLRSTSTPNFIGPPFLTVPYRVLQPVICNYTSSPHHRRRREINPDRTTLHVEFRSSSTIGTPPRGVFRLFVGKTRIPPSGTIATIETRALLGVGSRGLFHLRRGSVYRFRDVVCEPARSACLESLGAGRADHRDHSNPHTLP